MTAAESPIAGIPQEVWRPVTFPDFTNYYQVSSLGRIRRINPTGNNKPHGLLRPKTDKEGRRSVCLYGAVCKKMFFVHSLVATAFIGPRPDGMVINHINFKPSDNRVENLEYTTQRDNIHHSHKHGRMASGFKLPQTRISDQHVREIRELAAAGSLSQSQIATLYGINQTTVSQFHLRKSRKDVA